MKPIALVWLLWGLCIGGSPLPGSDKTGGDSATPVEIPDAATVKKHLTADQLAVGDPIVNSIDMILVPIAAGEFSMGSRLSAQQLAQRFDTKDMYFADEYSQHRVQIGRSFYLGAMEVTQEQYEQVMGKNPSRPKKPALPVNRVNWTSAVEFCRRLSEQPPETAAGRVYRLPTEAEWEYTCRGGTTGMYSFGNDPAELDHYGWYVKNALAAGEAYAHRVGQKRPNPWGLYDMHGNVWEWCQDWYGKYPSDQVFNPVGPDTGTYRVVRGGSWNFIAGTCRSTERDRIKPSFSHNNLGFRVVCHRVK